MTSYYEVLGLEPDADVARIREVYRIAAEDGRADRRLDEAYAVVADPDRRRRYDDLRLVEGSGGNAEVLALLDVISKVGVVPTTAEMLAMEQQAERAWDPLASSWRAGSPAEAPAIESRLDLEPPETRIERPEPEPEPVVTDDAVRHAEMPLVLDRPRPPTAGVAPKSPLPPLPVDALRRDGLSQSMPRPLVIDQPRPQGAADTASRPAGAHPVPDDRAQPGRGRLRVLLALLGLVVIAGLALGLAWAQRAQAPVAFTAGGCVSLAGDGAIATPCEAPEADARISRVLPDAARCNPTPLGSLDLGTRGIACLEELPDKI